MNIAEHKLNIFHQIDDLPEESLIELENVISTLKTNNAFHFTPKPKTRNLKTLLASWTPLDEDFPEIDDKPPAAEDFF